MAINLDVDMGILAKALKLLHSVEEDSAEQLRIMLEDTIKSKYGNKKPINLIGFGKKPMTDDVGKSKRMKIEESAVSSAMYSRETRSSDSDSDGGVALEILDDDLSCVVCGEMAVGAGNNLVECVECHSLYHQECHNPPIMQDVNDPRFVWYCANCSKTINKVGSNTAKVSSSGSGHSSKSSKSSSKSSSSSTKSFNAFSTSSKGSSSNPSSSKHSSGAIKSNPVPIPKINITADKRLQIMKKNAAKKQEKRKLTK